MTLIHVPRPDIKTAMNPDRPVNALLQTQIQHLQEAELKLPLAHQTDIYVNAIKTEGEAADYIRRVTEAIHEAHEAAATKRAKRMRRPGIAIAAAADEGSVRKPTSAAQEKSKAKAKPKRKR